MQGRTTIKGHQAKLALHASEKERKTMTPKIRMFNKASAAIVLAMGLAFSGASHAAEPAAKPALTPDQQAGRDIAFSKSEGNCLACHAMAGGTEPGNVGPMLVAMKIRYPDKEALFKVLWDPREKFGRGIIMPPFGDHKILTKEQINQVV
ncbi:MAG: sulfur oxidation c-type cytochrome SoxX, partial [Halothiobacillus sp.]